MRTPMSVPKAVMPHSKDFAPVTPARRGFALIDVADDGAAEDDPGAGAECLQDSPGDQRRQRPGNAAHRRAPGVPE